MMRSAVFAAVVAICYAVHLGGADATGPETADAGQKKREVKKNLNNPGALKVGTVLYHASTESDFRSLLHTPDVFTSETQDANLPSSPAWFAPFSSPAVSLHAATYEAFEEWTPTPTQQDPPQIYIYKYETRKAMALQQYDDELQASDVVGNLISGPKKQDWPEAFRRDFKQATARYFCSNVAAPNTMYHGYLVKKTVLRKELEYVLCKAHDPEYLHFVDRQQCRVRATKSKVEGATQPVIWVWCSFKVNKLRWYKWDLNVDESKPVLPNKNMQIVMQFKKAGLTDRPLRYPKLTSFREMLTKGKKSKGAVQPAAGDEDDQKFIKSPIGKAEMALLKQAADLIKKAAKSLKPEEVPH